MRADLGEAKVMAQTRALDTNYPTRYEWARLRQNLGDNEYDEALLASLEEDRTWLQTEVERLRAALKFCEAADIARRAGDMSYEDDRIELAARNVLTEEKP